MKDGKNGGKSGWPLLHQIRRRDGTALGDTAQSQRSVDLSPRISEADKVVQSICPYCGVGCGQRIYVKDEKIIDIEGDEDSPISEGCLCARGSATFQLVTGAHRHERVLHRRPRSTQWEAIPLEQAMDMVAQRIVETREQTWQETDERGYRVNRTLGLAHLGGATLDNEENYLIKKLCTALGMVQVENQARI